ncbi:trypsin-like peptidase domain-containing protein [Streptomyces sp. NPDC005549]|uniref:nSTAND1 domain-containing NTPase n=1 Tax=Streptomyces sp. NPDC005549 TaxID=3154888 RepID=UPI0033B88BC8
MPVTAPPGGHGPATLDSAVLRVTDHRGNCWGAGFLVGEQTALTCAHVVSAALGTPEEQPPAAAARVFVDLPLLPAAEPGRAVVPARIVHFAAGDDVAVLRLETAIPRGRPARMVDAPDVWGHPARIFGFPQGRPAGVWHAGVLRSRQADGWIQADLASDGYRVSGGFSGSPVWDEDLSAVVGMVAVAESGEPAASYLIPSGALLRVWEPLGALTSPASPFRGLAPFRETDVAFFHGREEESKELTAEVVAERQVCLVGPSGSGKSSLVLAGVVPRARAQGLSVGVLRPASGSRPLSALAAALLPLLEPDLTAVDRLDRLPSLVRVLARQGVADTVTAIRERRQTRGLVLVVDQFEELLVSAPDHVDELAAVLYTTPLPPGLHVLTTLRADFLDRALTHAQVGPAFRNRLHALGAPGPQQLRRMVTAPVAAVPGVGYEAGLVERVLADAGREPGALPLLGFTLDRLWRDQEGGVLTHASYEKLGGVAGALGQHAERLWRAHVPEPSAPAARRLFTALVRVPLGTSAITRRTALRGELDAEAWDIAQPLADARLLVTGRNAEGMETVEVAHEALIGEWRRLADWTEEDRAFLVWRETLRHDRERWEHGGRAPDLLPSWSALEAAERWLPERGRLLTDAERDYLRSGRAHRHARRRRRRALITVTASLTALAVLFGALFAYYRYVSDQRAAESASRALAQTSADLGTSDPVVSVMTALAAYRTSPTEQARDALLRARLAHRPGHRILSGSDGSVGGVAASEDGEVVLVHSNIGKPTLYVHAATGTVRRQRLDLPYQARLSFVSADGSRAGLFTDERELVWFDVRRDGEPGEPAGPWHRLPPRLDPPPGLSDVGDDATMSSDGRYVAQTGATAKSIAWWDLEGGTSGEVPLPAGLPDTSRFDGVHIGSDDRKLLATVWDRKTEKSTLLAIDRNTRHSQVLVEPTTAFTVSAAGNAVAECTSSKQGKRVLTVRKTGRSQETLRYAGPGLGDDDLCGLEAVTDSGRWAVTQEYDDEAGGHRFHLLDLDNGRRFSTEAAADPDTSVQEVVSVRGVPVILAATEKSVLYVPAQPESPRTDPLPYAALAPDGTSFVGLVDDGKRIVRRTSDAGGEVLAEAERRAGDLESRDAVLGFSADGKLVADQTGKSTVVLRRASDLHPLRTITAVDPPDRGGETEDPAFGYHLSPDSVVTVSGPVVQTWDRETGRQTARTDLRRLISGVSGKSVLTVGNGPEPGHLAVVVWGDPSVHIIDPVTGSELRTIRTGPDTTSIQFAPDGKHFAVLRTGGNVELWRSDPPRRDIGPIFTSDPESGGFVAQFLRDGRFLLASRTSVHFYDIGEGRAEETHTFGAPGDGGSTGYSYIDASADGRSLMFRDDESLDTAYRFIRLDAGLWTRQLCRMIGYREFTPSERESLGISLPEGPLCHDG